VTLVTAPSRQSAYTAGSTDIAMSLSEIERFAADLNYAPQRHTNRRSG
jgi:hypothetical protein